MKIFGSKYGSLRRQFRIVAAIAAILAISVATTVSTTAPAAAAVQTTIYVSPAGSDTASGSITTPLRTLDGARSKVASLNSSMTGDIVVQFRGGTYPFSNPTVFQPSDSGRNGHRVIYEAYPGETPVFEGGKPVTGWSLSSGNIWVADFTSTTKLRSLYVNGSRALLARSDGTQAAQGASGTYSITANGTWAMTSGSTYAAVTVAGAGLPSSFTNVGDMEVVNQVGFSFHVVGLSAVSTTGSNKSLTLQQPMGAIAFSQPQAWGAPFFNTGTLGANHLYLQNAKELLNQPGEFYFDNSADKLYYVKPSGVDLSTAEVIAPVAEGLIDIVGSSTSDRVENLTFNGLTFRHTHWSLFNVAGSVGATTVQSNAMYTKYFASGNWHDAQTGSGSSGYANTSQMPSAVAATNATGLEITNNTFQGLGSGGMSLANDSRSSIVTGNRFIDISGSAISVGDPRNTYIGDGDMASGIEGVPTDIVISNNVVDRAGAEFLQSSSIAAYYADGLRIEHNEISNAPYTGISMGWGFNAYYYDKPTGQKSSVARNNVIEFNRVSATMTVMHDGGAIYTLGAQPNSRISSNIIEATGGVSFGNAIYTDQSSSGFEIDHNIVDTFNGAWWFVWGAEARVSSLNVHDNSVSNAGLTGKKLLDAGDKATNKTVTNNRVGQTSQTFETSRFAGLEPKWRGLHLVGSGQFTRASVEAEWATPVGRAIVQPDSAASGGLVMAQLDVVGDGVVYSNVAGATGVTLRYATPNSGTVGLYINGARTASIPVSSSGAWFGAFRETTIDTPIPAGASVAIKNASGDVGINLDLVTFNVGSSTREAESGSLGSRAVVQSDSAAWGGNVVAQLDVPGDSVAFSAVPQTDRVVLRYATTQTGSIGLYVNGARVASIPVNTTGAWFGAFRTVTVDAAIPAGATVMVKNDAGDKGINLDRVDFIKTQPRYIEAESGSVGGRATVCATDFATFNQQSICQLDQVGDSISFSIPDQRSSLTLRYATATSGHLSVYVNGVDTATVNFASTGGWFSGWTESTIAVAIPAGATLMVKNDATDAGFNLDSISLGP